MKDLSRESGARFPWCSGRYPAGAVEQSSLGRRAEGKEERWRKEESGGRAQVVTEPDQSSWYSSRDHRACRKSQPRPGVQLFGQSVRGIGGSWPGAEGFPLYAVFSSVHRTCLCAACPRPGSVGVGLLLPADYLTSPMSTAHTGGHMCFSHLSHGSSPTSQPDIPSSLIMAGLDGHRSASLILCSCSAKTTPTHRHSRSGKGPLPLRQNKLVLPLGSLHQSSLISLSGIFSLLLSLLSRLLSF